MRSLHVYCNATFRVKIWFSDKHRQCSSSSAYGSDIWATLSSDRTIHFFLFLFSFFLFLSPPWPLRDAHRWESRARDPRIFRFFFVCVYVLWPFCVTLIAENFAPETLVFCFFLGLYVCPLAFAWRSLLRISRQRPCMRDTLTFSFTPPFFLLNTQFFYSTRPVWGTDTHFSFPAPFLFT